MSLDRKPCPECEAPCLASESQCWRCGTSLFEKAQPDDQINFASSETLRKPSEPAPAKTVMRTTLTGEVVEVPDFSAPVAPPEPMSDSTGVVAPPGPVPEPGSGDAAPVFRLTYCRTCGIQNDEGATVCRKCREALPVLSEPVPDIQPLRRSWGFDVLGLAWVALGASAVYCGRFIVKADPNNPGLTWADYFWTGIVVCAPGVMIFLRHYFCKIMFWTMTFASALIWAVIGFLWLYVGLHVSENGSVGLAWFAALSILSLLSFATVRLNDEFDFGS